MQRNVSPDRRRGLIWRQSVNNQSTISDNQYTAKRGQDSIKMSSTLTNVECLYSVVIILVISPSRKNALPWLFIISHVPTPTSRSATTCWTRSKNEVIASKSKADIWHPRKSTGCIVPTSSPDPPWAPRKTIDP